MRLTFPLFLLAGLALAGCDSMSERVHQRFSAVPPKVRVYSGDPQAVASAVKIAFHRLDFELGDSTDDISRIEASSRIHRNEGLNNSRQLVAEVRLLAAGPGQTEVRMLLTEQTEDASPGGREEEPMREHGFYGTFFDTVQQVLSEEAAAAPAPGK